MRRNLLLLPMLLLGGLVTACTAGAPASHVIEAFPTESTPATREGVKEALPGPMLEWTFFVYGSGDHARSAELVADLEAMNQAHFGEAVKVVVFADFEAGLPRGTSVFHRGAEWSVLSGDDRSPFILDRQVEQDLDDPSVLREAVSRAFATYPARHHAILVWSRGADGELFGVDQANGGRRDGRGIKLADASTAIRSGLSAAGIDRPIDLLAFDVEGAAGIDSAFELRTIADVFTSSSRIGAGRAWAYPEAFDFLGRTPTASAADFVRFEDEAFRASRAPRAHVALDATKLDSVGRATASFVRASSAEPEAIARIAAHRTASGDRTPELAAVFEAVANGPNLGVVTAAAENAREHLAAASLTPAGATARFAVTFPTAPALSPTWLDAYEQSGMAWAKASDWSTLLRAYAVRAGR